MQRPDRPAGYPIAGSFTLGTIAVSAANRTMHDREYNLGIQPIDVIMTEAGLSNRSLVEASDHPLTFKVVQKARKGRRLTPRTQEKVVRAMNAAVSGRVYSREDLFNYQ